MDIIFQDDKKTRLDKYLVQKYPHLSRSQIQKAIKNEEILVNDKPATVHNFLKTDDKITILQKESSINISPTPEPKKTITIKPNKNIKLNIIAETDDYLVINKPAGLLMHQTEKNEPDTLANAILAYYPKIKNVGDTPETEINVRPGIVHRLDKDVSGLLVIAKTQKMFEHLKTQFQERTIKKEYIALVYGTMSHSSGTIDFQIGMNKKTGKMAARPQFTKIKSKTALTIYEVTKQFQHYALLKTQIKTGRTHQIRVHLNALGYPVVGDETYKPKKLKTRVALNRIFLHSHILGFNDLKNEWQEFTQDIPEELNNFLTNLN